MPLKRILNIPTELGSSAVWYDEGEDRMVVQNSQDVESLLESNKREFCTDQDFDSEVANKVASIPLSVVLQWKQEGLDIFQNDPETQRKLFQKLNSREYMYLRTRGGKL